VWKREGRNYLEDLVIDGMLVLKWILRNRTGDVGWIDMAYDRERCWALVNAGINLQVP
jgi:hypothetical protein